MSIDDKGIHKGVFLIIVLTCLIVLISLLRRDMQLLPAVFDGLSMKSLRINDFVLNVTVAKTPEEMSTSLRNTRTMPLNQGMIFVFDQEGMYNVSTKNTHFPVDILWLDTDGFVVDMQTNALPGTPYPIYSRVLARYIVVVNAGVARSAHIDTHTYIFLPDLN